MYIIIIIIIIVITVLLCIIIIIINIFTEQILREIGNYSLYIYNLHVGRVRSQVRGLFGVALFRVNTVCDSRFVSFLQYMKLSSDFSPVLLSASDWNFLKGKCWLVYIFQTWNSGRSTISQNRVIKQGRRRRGRKRLLKHYFRHFWRSWKHSAVGCLCNI